MSKSLKHYVFTNFGIGIKDELWLSYRLEIFTNTVFPSLANQSNQAFEWTIFIDEALPVLHHARLEAAIASSGLNARTQKVSDYSLTNREVSKLLAQSHEDIVLTSRIDDDDCIHQDVIETIQQHARSNEHAEDMLLISLHNGLEFLPSDDCYRPVTYDTLALALTLVDKTPGTKTRSITQYAHHMVVETLKKQEINAKHILLKSKQPLYTYTKHPLSDSYFFGARARILGDTNKTVGLKDSQLRSFGLSQQRLDFLSALLKQSPIGMPHKYLEKLGNVRNQIKAELNKGTDQANTGIDALMARKARLERTAVRPNPAGPLKEKIRVAILGSCVTRDLFEFQKSTLDAFEICFYMARSSVISWMAPPCFDPKLGIDASSFEGKRSHWDKLKLHWRLLEESRPDIVIIDFIDERIGIVQHQSSLMSASGPLLKAFERKNITHEIKRPWSPEIQQLRAWALPAFLDKVGSICPNIFVHKAVWAYQYKANNTLESFKGGEFERLIELNNSIIDPMLATLEDSATAVEQIGGLEAGLVAGGDHKWAFCPYHYDSTYYKTVAKQLLARIMS
ncbi:DUF6270 domain-containing protein [Pseudomonas sp. PGPR81]|uniref:DUF6270 domain-containing protein n=1 Tax=unclassified Pseudomonas TaxID=196821 RepID=UPI001EDA700D|nr:DUF6270 domain-containing protein [Pseudomonas sp. PGPR81]